MVPKRLGAAQQLGISFRAVLFRMVPKQKIGSLDKLYGFRAVLFRMVPKQGRERY